MKNINSLLDKKIKMFEEIDRQITQSSQDNSYLFSKQSSNAHDKQINYYTKADYRKLYHFKDEIDNSTSARRSTNTSKNRTRFDNPSGQDTTKETEDKLDQKRFSTHHSKKTNLKSSQSRSPLNYKIVDKKTIQTTNSPLSYSRKVTTHQNNERSRSRTPKEINKVKQTIPPSKQTPSRSISKSKEKGINYYSQFDFKPKINSNSMRIAKHLDPPSLRLCKPKRKHKSPDIHITSSPSPSASSSKLVRPNSSLGKELHDHAKVYQARREERKIRKLVEEEEKLKSFSFKPSILSRSRSKSNETIRKTNQSDYDQFFIMQEQWKKTKDVKKERIKELCEYEKLEGCTFQPKINSSSLKDDEEFINKNLNQIMDYIIKRKKFIKDEKENKEKKNNFFANGKNFTIKPTIPKEFNFSQKKKQQDNKETQQTVDHVKMREILNSQEFFEQKDVFNPNYFSNEAFYQNRIGQGTKKFK